MEQEEHMQQEEPMEQIKDLYHQIKKIRISSGFDNKFFTMENNRIKYHKYIDMMFMILSYHGIIFGGFVRDWIEIAIKSKDKNYDINFDFESTVVLFGVNDIDVIISRNDFKKLISRLKDLYKNIDCKNSKDYPINIIDGFEHVKIGFHCFLIDFLIYDNEPKIPNSIDFDVNSLYVETCSQSMFHKCTNTHHFGPVRCVRSLINKNVDDIFKSIISHKATMISPTNGSLTSRSVKLQSKGYDVEIPAFVPMMEAGSINKPDPLPIVHLKVDEDNAWELATNSLTFEFGSWA